MRRVARPAKKVLIRLKYLYSTAGPQCREVNEICRPPTVIHSSPSRRFMVSDRGWRNRDPHSLIHGRPAGRLFQTPTEALGSRTHETFTESGIPVGLGLTLSMSVWMSDSWKRYALRKLRSCFLKLIMAIWTALPYSRTLKVVCGKSRPTDNRRTAVSPVPAAERAPDVNAAAAGFMTLLPLLLLAGPAVLKSIARWVAGIGSERPL